MRKRYMKKSNCIKILLILISIIFFTKCNVNANNNTKAETQDWEDWKNENYWEWHTRITEDDKAYNGEHIVIENDVIDFYGYWQNSYKDFLFKEYINPGKKIFKFRIDETKANYHTLDGAGFIFNASKESDKLSAYILLFKEKEICVYRINDVEISVFETTSNKLVSDYGELLLNINKTNSVIHDLIVEVTPTNLNVVEGEQELINMSLDYAKHYGESFGLISSYCQHSCSQLSKIQFSELEIKVEDYEVEIKNKIFDTDIPIPGSKIALYDENGKQVSIAITDSDGIVIFRGINPGKYTYKQLVVPEGYEINKNEYKCEVDIEGTVEFEEDDIIYNKKIIVEPENEINNNIINDEKDNTMTNSIIPYAGEKSSIKIIFIISITISTIAMIINLKKYKL